MTGSGRLMERPLSVYETLCREKDLLFDKKADSLLVRGPLKTGSFVIPGNISSQFVSGLLIALPLLEEDSIMKILPPVESGPYIEMTIAAMKRAGVTVEKTDALTFRIPGKQKYLPCVQAVEGDWSNAAPLLAMGLLVDGLDDHSLQGDRRCPAYIDQLKKGYARLDLSDCPDLGPVLIAAAALQHGAKFIGTRRLKIKESDRGLAMRQELDKMGVTVETEENEIFAHAGAECREEPADEECFGKASGLRRPKEPLDGHNDHRIVMALAVMLTKTGGTIRGAEAVRKSLPDFWDRLAELGVEMRVEQE
jgi:3-phosphoshikimate 1-carboxyvinyltransferase